LIEDKKESEQDKTFTFYQEAMTVNTLTESKPLYGTWDYIYEIGGWIGLFLGHSVMSAFDEIVNIFTLARQKIKYLLLLDI
jgi:hypothetical protein